MTRFAPLWQQANSYPASLDRQLMAALWPTGGVMGAAVTAVANTMNLNVAPGLCAVPLTAGQGGALCRWDATEVVPVTVAAAQPRVDLVVCQVRDNAIDAGPNNDFVLNVIAGTPAASNPVAPAVPPNACAVARVLVPGGAANLNAATITAPYPSLGQLSAVKMRVYNAVAPTIASDLDLPFDTVDYGGAFWDAAGRAFVAPVAGDFLATTMVTPIANIANFQAQARIMKNGAGAVFGAQIFQPTNSWGASSNASDIIRCVAGDRLTVRAAYGAGNALTVAGSANFFFTVRLMP